MHNPNQFISPIIPSGFKILLAAAVLLLLGTATASETGLPQTILDLKTSNKESFKVTIDTIDGKNRFQKGDSIRYSVSSNRICYFCLLSFQSDGFWTVLYPNAYESEIVLEPEKPFFIPSDNNLDYQYIVDAPFGTDTVCVIASSLQTELSLKVRQLTEQEPMYVSLDRGIFPIKTSVDADSDQDAVFWDVDWINIETSEFPVTETSALLSRRSASAVLAMGLLLAGGSFFLLRKRLS